MVNLVMSSLGGSVYQLDLVTRTTTFLRDFGTTLTDVEVAPDGRVFATTFAGLYELNMTTGGMRFIAASSGANALDLSASGRYAYLVNSTRPEISVIDVVTGQNIRTVTYAGADSAGDLVVRGGIGYLLASDRSLLQVDLMSGAVLSKTVHGLAGAFGLTFAGNEIVLFDSNRVFRLEANGSVTGIVTTSRLDGVISGASDTPLITRIGTTGADSLNGSLWDDRISGRDGNDTIIGFLGSDTVSGGAGNDVLNGGAGRDVVVGGTGSDWLSGGRGADTIAGGTGADYFVFASGEDWIMDFADNVDTLALNRALLGAAGGTVATALSYARDVGSDVLFDFGGGNVVRLVGVATVASMADDLLLI